MTAAAVAMTAEDAARELASYCALSAEDLLDSATSARVAVASAILALEHHHGRTL